MIMSQEDSPTTSFRPFFNPATGEWITYTAIADGSCADVTDDIATLRFHRARTLEEALKR